MTCRSGGVIGRVAPGLAVALACAGCTGGPTPSPTATVSVVPEWRAFIDQALADPHLGSFARDVLSDYQVTDAEYGQARDRYVQCMADKGWIVTEGANPGYQVAPVPGSGNETRPPGEDASTCAPGTTGYVEAVYLGMRDNPQGRTRGQQVRACFEANGVPDGAGLSDDQFEAMIGTPGYHASTREGKLCYWDPTGSLGLTVEEAEAMDRDSGAHTPIEEPPATP